MELVMIVVVVVMVGMCILGDYKSFEWTVISFSLTNVSTAFQWFMNDIFLDLLNICSYIPQ